jgi:hypothetical protein
MSEKPQPPLKAAYVAPAIVTYAVAPSHAKHGSEQPTGHAESKHNQGHHYGQFKNGD